ncbi:flagellin modification protein PtmC, N-acetylneuraminic acid synthetase [Campylobacter insulaenigrae]|uniref:N-acetylneuraminate synthase n=1 Tax=Campylobacter insulaenigrae TaxID=260714 RepID=UPI000F6C8002|nr:N-acetylneuraminate synthase [Campylobacter insulaenigrae]MCR6591954.1 N-acetylneuraminate synthase [Campylobacter insulaenigrae]MCR6593477.1 N-acetylneuraminate synthase [Campylobacter insulaenigrae]VEJ54933.1 flagellin modification protein PtmC, N-acetylneuraminic acid synthetase [Campylobacter insulaenigrae]
MKKTIIIAEAGVNHNGDINLAKKLIELAAKAGADYVKFQSFIAKDCVCAHTKKAQYQINNTQNNKESQLEMIEKLELDKKAHEILIAHCKKHNIKFLSTPFDLASIELLSDFNLDFFKIPSGEITNFIYLKKIAKLNKKIILSTGMSNLGEIEEAINVLVKYGTKRKNIKLLHCNSAYPTPFEDVNLKAMQTIKDTFKLDVGYSDHTLGIHISLAAVALGACVIEKHFTLDKNMQGPDHLASLDPQELYALCKNIRELELSFGDGIKKASKSEKSNLKIVRKFLVANKDIKKGERFNEENLRAKRSGGGICAMKYEKYINKIAKKNYKKDEIINE